MRSLTQRHVTKCMAISMALILVPCVSFAIPISTDLVITASVELDPASLEPYGGTQTGSLSITSGGATTTSNINSVTVNSSNPLGGMLTDTGDGVGMDFQVSGMEIETEMYGNYNMSFANNSVADSYLVTLGFISTNLVGVVGELGNDVYAQASMILSDGITDLFYTYRYIDLYFEEDFDDTVNGILFTYDLLLGAGDIIDLSGIHDIYAGAYDFDTGYDITLATAISIMDVQNLTAQVPEPPIALLFGAGLVLLLTVNKRKLGGKQLHVA